MGFAVCERNPSCVALVQATGPETLLPSGSHGVGRLVGQDRGARGALGPGRDAHGAVLHLFEEIGFAAGSAEPEMFHTTCSALVRSGHGASDVEDVDTALAEIVEWFAALWIRAVIHHGGTSAKSRRLPCSASSLLGKHRIARP